MEKPKDTVTSELEIPNLPKGTRLKGRTAIVTGAGSAGEMGGSGADIAVVLALQGARVVVVDVSEERGQHTLRAIQSFNGSATLVTSDITIPENCEAVVQKSLEAFGKVDILVNNAAIAPDERDNTDSTWDAIMALNLKAPKLMSDAVVPSMVDVGSGSIVHISSIAGFRAGGGVGYSAAKGGLIAMAKTQALNYGPAGIRVNTVAPGHVAIPMGLGFQGWEGSGTARMRKRRARASMLGTEGTGWDVALAVLYLASDESRYVTGHTIPVDGGTTETMPIVLAEQIESA